MEQETPARFVWLKITARFLWYLFLLVMIFILFQGPEKGFRYLGL